MITTMPPSLLFSSFLVIFMILGVTPSGCSSIKYASLSLIHILKPWGRLGDIGAVISEYVHQHGYTVLRDIGGHGVGNDFHEDPYVCHIGKRGTGMLLVPGMVFTIEPMVNEGKEDFFVDEENEWTVYTEDGSLSAQWEYTVAVTEDGVEIITH